MASTSRSFGIRSYPPHPVLPLVTSNCVGCLQDEQGLDFARKEVKERAIVYTGTFINRREAIQLKSDQ